MDVVMRNTYEDAPHLQNTTININGIESSTKMRMLADFLQKNDVEIAPLQEVTHHNFDSLGVTKQQ
jgi:exonuclease III